jgi:two-component system, OmpR family, response regulator MprA
MLVLVADDDRAVREALERALQLHGYEVALASDGDTALTAVDSRTPDAVVLDVMMPGLDGLDVTRRLRRQGNRIPILLLTARDAVGDRVEGLDAGATWRSFSRGCAHSCAARSPRSRAKSSVSRT